MNKKLSAELTKTRTERDTLKSEKDVLTEKLSASQSENEALTNQLRSFQISQNEIIKTFREEESKNNPEEHKEETINNENRLDEFVTMFKVNSARIRSHPKYLVWGNLGSLNKQIVAFRLNQ